MVWEVSIDARDKKAPKDDHQCHYVPPVRSCIFFQLCVDDLPMRTFSQPSNIENTKVDSNNIRQRQIKRLKGVLGGL